MLKFLRKIKYSFNIARPLHDTQIEIQPIEFILAD
jgi:hypothetical protein